MLKGKKRSHILEGTKNMNIHTSLSAFFTPILGFPILIDIYSKDYVATISLLLQEVNDCGRLVSDSLWVCLVRPPNVPNQNFSSTLIIWLVFGSLPIFGFASKILDFPSHGVGTIWAAKTRENWFGKLRRLRNRWQLQIGMCQMHSLFV